MCSTLIPETNDEARELFANSGLTYDDIDGSALKALQAFADIELARCRLNPSAPLHVSMRMTHKVDATVCEEGGIESAFLYVNGSYFKKREVFSFNSDGFIGIAGWADSKNTRPFLVAFGQWVEWMVNRAEGMA